MNVSRIEYDDDPSAGDLAELVAGLVRQAEINAARRSGDSAHLDTFDFQALPFCRQPGYRVFGELPEFPPGHTHFPAKRGLGEQRNQ